MKSAARVFGLTLVVCGCWTSMAKAEVLAEYTYSAANLNPNTQGWTWNGAGTVINGGDNLLMSESQGAPSFLFTKAVPTAAMSHPWSFTGTNRYAGNGQEELTMMMFVDDGTNLWHMSFHNSATTNDGIYMGGDPNHEDPGANTATLVWPETPNPGPFDGFHDWSLVDSDGFGGAPPTVHLDGVSLTVAAIPAASMFPAGTVGWGSLNIWESGFHQTKHMVFDGTVPEPNVLALAATALFGLAFRRPSKASSV